MTQNYFFVKLVSLLSLSDIQCNKKANATTLFSLRIVAVKTISCWPKNMQITYNAESTKVEKYLGITRFLKFKETEGSSSKNIGSPLFFEWWHLFGWIFIASRILILDCFIWSHIHGLHLHISAGDWSIVDSSIQPRLCIAKCYCINMVIEQKQPGFEPWTSGFKIDRSTNPNHTSS